MKTVVFLSDYENEIEYQSVFDLLSLNGVQGITAKPSEITISNSNKGTDFYFNNMPLLPQLVIGYAYEEDLIPAMKLMKLWQMQGIPVLNNADTLFSGQNKDLSSAILNSTDGIRHLPYLKFTKLPDKDELSKIGFPLVAKPVNGACGQGLFKFDTYAHFIEWINKNETIINDYYIQPYIPKMNNEDFRIVVVNHIAKYAYSRKAKNNGWITNLVQNGEGKIFTIDMLPKKLTLMAEKASKATNSPFCGVDIALDELGNPFIIEINTCPAIKINRYIPEAETIVEQSYADFILQKLINSNI